MGCELEVQIVSGELEVLLQEHGAICLVGGNYT